MCACNKIRGCHNKCFPRKDRKKHKTHSCSVYTFVSVIKQIFSLTNKAGNQTWDMFPCVAPTVSVVLILLKQLFLGVCMFKRRLSDAGFPQAGTKTSRHHPEKKPSKYKINKCEKLIAHCAAPLGWEAMSQRKVAVTQRRENHKRHIRRLIKNTICVLL